MLRFHRTTYTTADGVLTRSSWWQIGDLILRHRQTAL